MAKIRRPGRKWAVCPGVTIRDRFFTQGDLVAIRRLIRQHPTWGRTRISQRLCVEFQWFQPNGRSKDRACRVALLQLEGMGYLELPMRMLERGGRPPRQLILRAPNSMVKRISKMPLILTVEPVITAADSRAWNGLVATHHYLGVATPVGRLIRYTFYGDSELLAAISFTECAWRVRARDTILRQAGINSASVIANNRFLILPTVGVPNLASRILALAIRRVRHDWSDRFGVRPLVVETFVDPSRYSGTCYRAANWVSVGETKGFAKCGAAHLPRHEPKLLLLRGLTGSAHRRLCLAIAEQLNHAA